MIALIYRRTGLQLLSGDEANVSMNVHMYELEEGVQARSLDDTPLADVGSILDERIPQTVEEFDALFGKSPVERI